MIKINLLRTVGGYSQPTGMTSPGGTSGGGGGGGGMSSGPPASTSAKNQAGGKIIVMLILPIIFYVYDNIARSDLEKQLADTRANAEKLTAEKAKFGDTGVKMEALTKEKKVIDEQVDAIKVIARTRLKEVKSLDALQTLTPQRTWLNKISINKALVKVTGYTSGDDGIAEMIRGLENSSFFSKVEPKSTSEEKVGTTVVKKFELEFRVGKSQE